MVDVIIWERSFGLLPRCVSILFSIKSSLYSVLMSSLLENAIKTGHWRVSYVRNVSL